MQQFDPMLTQKDTSAWIFQVWAAFIISTSAFGASLYLIPMDNLVKSQLGISYLFSISSTFTLAKTIRDNHEAKKRDKIIQEIVTSQIITQHHPITQVFKPETTQKSS